MLFLLQVAKIFVENLRNNRNCWFSSQLKSHWQKQGYNLHQKSYRNQVGT